MLADGTLAPSGFTALAEFDMNKDGKIDISDKVFSQLKMWQDSNSDGVSQETELKSLNEMGISSIGLSNNTINIVKNGNTEARKGSYTLSDGTTKDITEYLFSTNGMDTIDLNAVEVSEEVKNMMEVSGSGIMKSMQQAMAADETGELQHWVKVFTECKNFDTRRDLVNKELLFEWAGVSDIAPDSRGGSIDARKLAVIEKFMGQEFVGVGGSKNPNPNAAVLLLQSYNMILEKTYLDMMMQTHLKPYMDMVTAYKESEDATEIKFDLSSVEESMHNINYVILTLLFSTYSYLS